MENLTSLAPLIAKAGVAASHSLPPTQDSPVAPTDSDNFNTIRAALFAIACWRLDDARFEFDSSFVLPETTEELVLLAQLLKIHPKAPLSVFGHADPVGNDDYNKQLSGRRAQAIYGLLIRDTALWEDLHSHPFSGDNWGLKSTQFMLETLGHSPGTVVGVPTSKTTEAIKAFQTEQGLTADGVAGPATRAKLFLAYMDAICIDEAGQPFSLQKGDFLAQGADPGGKGDFQGCGEFNPILMFSQEENAKFEKAPSKVERNAENEPNRRVVILLFRPGSRVAPARWPCPRAKEGVAGCKARFFSDAAVRRTFQEKRRKFEETKDTFACRFYQRITGLSPCETIRTTLRIRLFDPSKDPIPKAPYRLTFLSSGEVRQGTAQADGVLIESNVVAPSRCLLRWGDPRLKQTPVLLGYQLQFFLDIVPDDEEEASFRRRLNNLGYTETEFLSDAVSAFQKEYEIAETGELDAKTKQAIIDAADHGLSKSEIAAS